jgi:hypothetical protein
LSAISSECSSLCSSLELTAECAGLMACMLFVTCCHSDAIRGSDQSKALGVFHHPIVTE